MATIAYLFVVVYYGIPYLMTLKLPPPSVPSSQTSNNGMVRNVVVGYVNRIF